MSDMIAVVETEEFLADVKGVLSEEEQDDLILYVAHFPEAGDVIPETGGHESFTTFTTSRFPYS